MKKERLLRVFLVIAIILMLAPQFKTEAAPPPVYVDAGATGANTGSSWTDAYTDLQDGLLGAISGGEIWVAEGTYYPGSDRYDFFELKDGVEIYGGFPGGGGDGSFGCRDWELFPTILSGDIGVAGAETDNSYHVVVGDGVGGSTLLDGFVIEHGYADASGMEGGGGGMFNDDLSTPVLRNLILRENYAQWGGGMRNMNSSAPTLENVIFLRNRALHYGGGMQNVASAPVFAGVIFHGNRAGEADPSGYGGGLYNTNNSSPDLINVLFSGNYATASGGGIYNVSGEPDLINVTLVANKAGVAGGGMYDNTVYHSVENTIVWGNQAPSDAQIAIQSTSLNVWKSMIEGGCPSGTASCNTVAGTPDFVRDPSAGADAIWGTADDDYGDLRQEYASPGIDSGDNAVVSGITGDIAGNPRIVYASTATAVDLGAYENPPAVIYVDGSAPGGSNGMNWYDAFTTLQPALGWLKSGPAQVWVAQGVYKPGAKRIHTFKLVDKARVYGGFPTGGGDLTSRDPHKNPTVLSGEIGSIALVTDNVYHVVTASPAQHEKAILDGFTITMGFASGDCSSQLCSGAGLYNNGGLFELRNILFTANLASYGGGMATQDTPNSEVIYLRRVSFMRNYATQDGGGLWNSGGKLTLFHSSFQGNKALRYGGGVYHENNVFSLWNALFSGNYAQQSGGGVYAYGGGGYTLFDTNSTFMSNQADISGDAIYLANIDLELYNSLIYSPSTYPIYKDAASTVEANSSLLKSGCPSGVPGWTCLYVLTVDPKFVREPDEGADGDWATMDDDYGNLRLQENSAAIDAGDSSEVGGVILEDLDGFYRYVDAPWAPNTGFGYLTYPVIDIGAYEAHIEVYLPIVVR